MNGWDEKLVELADMVAPGFLDAAKPVSDMGFFYTCHRCDQAVDKRVPADVRHHERRGHSPRLKP